MKKTIIALFLMGSVLSANAYSDDTDIALIAGLVGLALIVGDGHTSFGVHFDSGHYNYRGSRYNNRAAYLRAVARYEAERRYYQRNRYYSRNSHRSYSNSNGRYHNFRYQDDRSDNRWRDSDRYDNDRSDNRNRDRDGRDNDRDDDRRSR